MELRHQPPDAFCSARIRLRTKRPYELGQDVISFEETLGARALVRQLSRRLLPRAVDLAEHVLVRNERVLEYDLVELALAAHLPDLVAGDALGLHVDDEIRQTMASIFLGRL